MISTSAGAARKKLSIRQKIAVVTIAVATAIGGSMVAAAPAAAGTSECDSGNFCSWNNGDYNGYQGGWSGNLTSWPSGIRNAATSLYNNGNLCGIRFFDEINSGGYYGDLARKTTYAQLAQWWIVWPAVNFDNRIEGHSWQC